MNSLPPRSNRPLHRGRFTIAPLVARCAGVQRAGRRPRRCPPERHIDHGAPRLSESRSSRLIAALYALGISGVILPPAVVTVVLLLRQLGLAGTVIGMICVYLGIYLSTVIFFVTGFVRTIPVALEEAAQLDGAGPLLVFRRVVLPLLRPVLATATILICLYVWNDVFYAFFVVGGRLDTLPLNLFRVASAGLYLNNWHLIFAYVILMSLPLVVVFAVAQRRIISGITGGAVK